MKNDSTENLVKKKIYKIPKHLRVVDCETIRFECARYQLPYPFNKYIKAADPVIYLRIARVICTVELCYFVICLALNIIHFSIYLPINNMESDTNFPATVFIATLLELVVAVALQVI
jgi:hypothetical protein